METNEKHSNFGKPWIRTIPSNLVRSFSNLLHQVRTNILRTILELHALRNSDPILRDFRAFIGPIDNHGAPLQHKQAGHSIECDSPAVPLDPCRSPLRHAPEQHQAARRKSKGARTLGPMVTLTASARSLTPCSMAARAPTPKATSFAAYPRAHSR